MSSVIRVSLLATLLACQSSTSSPPASPPDAADFDASSSDGAAACVRDPAVPFSFDRALQFPFANVSVPRLAASPEGRVGMVFNSLSDSQAKYVESLDGGQTFAPPLVLGPQALNLRVEMAHGFAYATYNDTGIAIRRAALDKGPVTSFGAPVSVGQNGEVPNAVILGPAQRIAVTTMFSGRPVTGPARLSHDAGASFGSPIPIDPMGAGGFGVFDRDGRLFIAYFVESATGWTANVRVLEDRATEFSAPASHPVVGNRNGLLDVFMTPAGEVGITSLALDAATKKLALTIERFAPSSKTWGDATTVFDEGRLNCFRAAVLADGRLALLLRTEGAASDPFLMVSADGGKSFAPRQVIPTATFQQDCPLMATDGRALYFVWSRLTDGSAGFLRGTQPEMMTCR